MSARFPRTFEGEPIVDDVRHGVAPRIRIVITTTRIVAIRTWPLVRSRVVEMNLAQLKAPFVHSERNVLLPIVGFVVWLVAFMTLVWVGASAVLGFPFEPRILGLSFPFAIIGAVLFKRKRRQVLLLMDDQISVRFPIGKMPPDKVRRIAAVAVEGTGRLDALRPRATPTFRKAA